MSRVEHSLNALLTTLLKVVWAVGTLMNGGHISTQRRSTLLDVMVMIAAYI